MAMKESQKVSSNTCPLCGSQDTRLLYNLKDYHILKCPQCAMVFTPEPDIDLPGLYSPEYYEDFQQNYFVQTRENYAKAKRDPKLKNFALGLELLKSKNKSGKILDVGCAQGMFLDMARNTGWETFGVDVSEYASNYAREKLNLNVFTGELQAAHFPPSSFDVVTLWDTAEHLPDPRQVLDECSRVLKDDGLLYLVTIDEDSLMPSLAKLIYKSSRGAIKKPVALLHPVHHVSHFSKTTLLRALETSGFSVIQITKGEVPLQSLRWGSLTRSIIAIMYFFSKLTNRQYEIRVLAEKNTIKNR
jgi:2-polyprenyl-3-methyl-5-hydroxy-6-metoxy-1,4-benzoquinol methylase